MRMKMRLILYLLIVSLLGFYLLDLINYILNKDFPVFYVKFTEEWFLTKGMDQFILFLLGYILLQYLTFKFILKNMFNTNLMNLDELT